MRNHIFLVFTIILPLCGVVQSQNRPADDKPNFVLIVADDLGFADLSMHGSKQIKTPNIDRLAEAGINFTNGYVSSPVCSPSRAGFLTGRNQVRFGHDNNLAANQPGFDPPYRRMKGDVQLEVPGPGDYREHHGHDQLRSPPGLHRAQTGLQRRPPQTTHQ